MLCLLFVKDLKKNRGYSGASRNCLKSHFQTRSNARTGRVVVGLRSSSVPFLCEWPVVSPIPVGKSENCTERIFMIQGPKSQFKSKCKLFFFEIDRKTFLGSLVLAVDLKNERTKRKNCFFLEFLTYFFLPNFKL